MPAAMVPQDCALYWVRFDDLLKNLRHTNFEPYVKDSILTQTAKVQPVFFINGQRQCVL